MTNLKQQITSNRTKTWLIISLFIVFVTTLVYVLGKAMGFGNSTVILALFMSSGMSLVSYFYSDKMVLAMSGAKQIKKSESPEYYSLVEKLAKEDDIPMPKVYIMQDPALNAFATGRDPQHAVVAATSGILERLNKTELEGVLAHELSHVKNYDIRVMTIVSILVGFVSILGNMFFYNSMFGGGNRDDDGGNNNGIFSLIGFVFIIFAPIIATLIQLAVSRKREFLADASGALLTRYPEGLASALEKIGSDRHTLKTANNATAHLFISNPFKGRDATNWIVKLFSTHPPIEERIKILRSM